MKSILLSFLQITIILLFIFSNLHSDIKAYDGEEFDLITYRLKVEKIGIPGSGYVEKKPDPLNVLTKKLVLKGMKYIVKFGLESTISLINEKPRKFRDFKTHLFIIDINGNVLAHSGNPFFADKNMMFTKNSIGHLFIQEYINNIQEYDGINYINFLKLEDNTQYIYNFVYLERIDDNLIIGAVAKP